MNPAALILFLLRDSPFLTNIYYEITVSYGDNGYLSGFAVANYSFGSDEAAAVISAVGKFLIGDTLFR